MTNEELVMKIQANENRKDCLEKLYRQNYGMLVVIVKKYKQDFDDLMQEAFIGLMTASERWTPDKGADFISYARYWMIQAVHKYACENGLVKVSASKKNLIYKYKKVVNEYRLKHAVMPPDGFLIDVLGITHERLETLKIDAKTLDVISLDTEVSGADNVTLLDTVQDTKDDMQAVEDKIDQERLATALWGIVDELEPIQKDTIHERYKHGKTIKETAQSLGVSESKVTSAEHHALRAMRRNKARELLKAYMSDSRLYSLSLKGGFFSFANTHTSSPERAVLLREKFTQIEAERAFSVGKNAR